MEQSSNTIKIENTPNIHHKHQNNIYNNKHLYKTSKDKTNNENGPFSLLQRELALDLPLVLLLDSSLRRFAQCLHVRIARSQFVSVGVQWKRIVVLAHVEQRAA